MFLVSNPFIILIVSAFSPITSAISDAKFVFNTILSNLPFPICKNLFIITAKAFWPVAAIAIPSLPLQNFLCRLPAPVFFPFRPLK